MLDSGLTITKYLKWYHLYLLHTQTIHQPFPYCQAQGQGQRQTSKLDPEVGSVFALLSTSVESQSELDFGGRETCVFIIIASFGYLKDETPNYICHIS